MNEDIIRRALMGVRRGTGGTVRVLGHTSNSLKLLGKTNNTGTKVSHTKTKQ